MKALSKYCFILSLTIQFFDYSFSCAQSKKEQIEILNYQKDSLQNLLTRESELYKSEIYKLSLDFNSLESKMKELSRSNENSIKENVILKAQVAELNNKLDSISSLKFGELLKPMVDIEGSSEDCIYNYFYNKSTIVLPRPSDLMNYSFIDILPVGWSKEGVFAYNWVSESVCGLCYAGMSLFDFRTNAELLSHNYNLEPTAEMGEEGSRCNILQVINADKQKEFSYHSITPISDLKMNYIVSSEGSLFVENKIFKIDKNGRKAALVVINPIGEKSQLYEGDLKRFYDSNTENWCEEDIQINGCFYNPLNKRQLIVHLYKIVPCGFEHEDEYSSFFVSVNF
jgi:hypothetical protein